jgi:hypothetical protein
MVAIENPLAAAFTVLNVEVTAPPKALEGQGI